MIMRKCDYSYYWNFGSLNGEMVVEDTREMALRWTYRWELHHLLNLCALAVEGRRRFRQVRAGLWQGVDRGSAACMTLSNMDAAVLRDLESVRQAAAIK
jgi:hypothetical protein